MIVVLKIGLVAALLIVFAAFASIQLLKGASKFLGEEQLSIGCMEDVKSSLRDAGLFLCRLGGDRA